MLSIPASKVSYRDSIVNPRDYTAAQSWDLGNTTLLGVNLVAEEKKMCNDILKIAWRFKCLFGS